MKKVYCKYYVGFTMTIYHDSSACIRCKKLSGFYDKLKNNKPLWDDEDEKKINDACASSKYKLFGVVSYLSTCVRIEYLPFEKYKLNSKLSSPVGNIKLLNGEEICYFRETTIEEKISITQQIIRAYPSLRTKFSTANSEEEQPKNSSVFSYRGYRKVVKNAVKRSCIVDKTRETNPEKSLKGRIIHCKNIRKAQRVKDVRKVQTVKDVHKVQTVKDVHKEQTVKDVHKEQTVKDVHKEQTVKDVHKEQTVKDVHKEQTVKDVHKEQNPSSKSLNDKEPGKGTLKRKRWYLEKLKSSDGYEDDIFEEKNFYSVQNVPDEEEDSDSSDVENMATPKWCISLSPRERSESPTYEDCYSPEELSVSRKEAEEYQFRRFKRRKTMLLDNKNGGSSQKIKKESPDSSKVLENVCKILMQQPKNEKDSGSESEDSYFTDTSEDES